MFESYRFPSLSHFKSLIHLKRENGLDIFLKIYLRYAEFLFIQKFQLSIYLYIYTTIYKLGTVAIFSHLINQVF